LKSLSTGRANSVVKAIQSYANSHGLILENSQLRHSGVGSSDPPAGVAWDIAGFAKMRRVQFMILKVPADKVVADEFDL